MSARAIIVGIDEYATQPLTSAVSDAKAFAETLVKLRLVEQSEIVLLTDDNATRDEIGRVLQAVYDHGAHLDRLFFYFSGHGLMAPLDAAGSVLCTALIPSDVEDLRAQGYLLINLDDLRDRLRLAGPREQFMFVDACRDLAFGPSPGNVPDLNWPASPNPSGPANGQAVLYAVSPRGRALGVTEGMGVMTGHLVDAVGSAGLALDWSDDLGRYVVTMESVRNHVRARVREAIKDLPYWEQQYMLPELVTTDPQLTPLLEVHDPPKRPLLITVEPGEFTATTTVTLAQRRNPLAGPYWPPFGEAVAVEPQRYEIVARCTTGDATADPQTVDVRERSSAVVRVKPFSLAGPAAPQPLPPSEVGPGVARVSESGPWVGDMAPTTGSVFAQALEPQASIEIEGLDPPYLRRTAQAYIRVEVPPGYYRVSFRLGTELFSVTDLEVTLGADITVKPTVARSPLLEELLGATAAAENIVISEHIGPIQATVLPTMLPILAVKPFDRTGALLGQFPRLVPDLDPAEYGDRPLAVVLAVEGERWPWPIDEMLANVECSCHELGGRRRSIPVRLDPLPSRAGTPTRMAAGFTVPPEVSFSVNLAAPQFGRIDVAGASLPGRVTAVTAILRPDGVLDVAENILRIPGRPYPEPIPDIPYSRFVRELQLGRKLYESGELVQAGDVGPGLLGELLHAKWTDPLMGCMAYFAWRDASEGPDAAPWAIQEAVGNLQRYFPDLPDSRTIAGMENPSERDSIYRELLERQQVPVLARSARVLAGFAVEIGAMDATVIRWVDSLRPGATWTAAWDLSNVVWEQRRDWAGT